MIEFRANGQESLTRAFIPKKEKEDMKKLTDSCPTPENCNLPTPKLNIEIWQLLNSYQKRSDVRMSMIQRNIIAATSGVISLVKDVLESKLDNQALVQKSTDIIGLLGHSTNEISLKRKLFIKSALNEEYKDLVSLSNNDEVVE